MTRRSEAASIRGIVLVGTHPWANSAFDRLLPRTLLPVAHRPLISYALSWLRDGAISDVSVCANRETQLLEAVLDRHVPEGVSVAYVEDAMPRGAAGAARDAALATDASQFVITDGTSIPNVDLRDLLAHHEQAGAAITVVVQHEASGPGRPCAQVPTGIYVCSREALEAVPACGFFDLKENLVPQLYRAGRKIVAYGSETVTPRVLDASSYLAVNEWMVERLVATIDVPAGYERRGSCVYHRDALVAEQATFVGPVLIEAGARVMPGAIVVGPASVGRDVVVGSGALVSRSAVWRRCVIGEQSIADRCILADETIIAPQTQAFRSVVFNQSRNSLLERAVKTGIRTPMPAEVFKQLGRLASGTTLSRFPAAQ